MIWPNNDEVVIGFSTSPAQGTADDRTVDGSARLLAFGVDGELKARRDIPYVAYGYGEIVAEGEATAGPQSDSLITPQSPVLQATPPPFRSSTKHSGSCFVIRSRAYEMALDNERFYSGRNRRRGNGEPRDQD